MNNYENLSSEEKLQKIQERFFPYQSLEHLRGIKGFGWDPDDLFRESDLELLTCLKELKEVVIYAQKDLSPQGFERLKKLSDLRSIHLYGSDVDDLALESLADITSLECLVLERGTLTDNGLENLRRLPNLQLLSLNDFPNLTLEGIRKILPEMKAIRRIDLPGHLTNDQTMDFLATQPQLEMAQLEGNITDYGLHKILSLPNLKGLFCLGLKNITEDGWRKLAECSQLVALDIRGTQTLTSFDFELPKLRDLKLKQTPNLKRCSFDGMTNLEELEIVGSTPELKGLEKLHLMKNLTCNGPEDHTEIYDAIGQMPHLEELTWIQCKNLNSTTVEALTSRSELKKLMLIEMSSPIEPEVAARFGGLSRMENLCISLSERNAGTGLPFLKNMPNLERFVTDRVALEDTDLRTLTTLKNLRELMAQFESRTASTKLYRLAELPVLQTLGLMIFSPKDENGDFIYKTSILPVELRDFPVLQKFQCYFSGKMELTLENLPKLQEFQVQNVESLEALTLVNLPQLAGKALNCPELKRLVIRDLPELFLLNCNGCTSLSDLRIQNVPALSHLRLTSTPMDLRGIGILESVKNLVLDMEQYDDEEVLLALQCLPNLREVKVLLPGELVSRIEEEENQPFLPPQEWNPNEDDDESMPRGRICSVLNRIQDALPDCNISPLVRRGK